MNLGLLVSEAIALLAVTQPLAPTTPFSKKTLLSVEKT